MERFFGISRPDWIRVVQFLIWVFQSISALPVQ